LLPEMSALPPEYTPLRLGANTETARSVESRLGEAFARAPASEWTDRLRASDLLVELVADMDRDGFRRALLDDALNRQLRRVVAYETEDWGVFEQIGPLMRCGPDAGATPSLMLPGIGEHTIEVLRDLGCSGEEIDQLLARKIAHQGSGITPPRQQ
jgi:crotonobetainyl-CoA:carnitine CoA-transferase CaiB-like acyl-CoA transferase